MLAAIASRLLVTLVLVSFRSVLSSPVEPVLASVKVPRDQTLGVPSYNFFTSKLQDDVNIGFVQNSGVCETTPGVQQMSGYIDVGTNMSMVCPLLTAT